MGEFTDYFKQKKNLLNLLVLAIIVLALPLGINLIRQQQILQSRANVDAITFTAGENVKQQADGSWIALKPQISFTLTSPLGPAVSTQTVQSEDSIMSVLSEGLIGTVYAGHCENGNPNSTSSYCDGTHLFQDGPGCDHTYQGNCAERGAGWTCSGGQCVGPAAPPPGNPAPADGSVKTAPNLGGDQYLSCQSWTDHCDPSQTCIVNGKTGVTCTATCTSCGMGQGMTWGGTCAAGNQWTVCVEANKDTQGGPCKETATLSSDCAMCIYKEKNKSGGNLYDTVRGMDVQRLAQCNYEQVASVWCNEVDKAGCESIRKGACGQPTVSKPGDTYPSSPNCSVNGGLVTPGGGNPAPNPNDTGTLTCKTVLEPSTVGINSPTVCDRLHDYVLVNRDGSASTCSQNDTCTKQADCPANTSDLDHIPSTTASNWCYGFKDGARCLQLRYTGLPQEPGCAAGEGSGGPNGCTNLDACSKCILTTKDTIIPYYASNGRDTSCSSLGSITNEWCSSVDPTGCQSLKSGDCKASCGGTTSSTCPLNSNLTITPSTANVGDTMIFQYKAGEDVFIGGDTWSGGIDSNQCQFDLTGRKYTCTAKSAVDNGVWQHRWNNQANCGSATYTIKGTTPPSVTTVSFRIAENPTDLTKATWQDYKTDGMSVDWDFKTPGQKFIFVQFQDSAGNVTNSTNCPKCQAQITVLGAGPAITGCGLTFEGNTTTLNLTGKNFGTDKGTIKSGETPLAVGQWTDDSIQAIWPNNAPEGKTLDVIVTNAFGQEGPGQCSAISQLALGAKVFCRKPSDHATQNIEMVLAGAYPGGTLTRQKVAIDKDGLVQGLSQKLEAGRPYKISLRAPFGLRKAASFTAATGTTNIPDFVLPIGDIFPPDGGDETINNFDRSELNRQWVIAQAVANRTGDFNKDTRVNSVDWACMRYDFNVPNDPEPKAGSTATSSASIK